MEELILNKLNVTNILESSLPILSQYAPKYLKSGQISEIKFYGVLNLLTIAICYLHAWYLYRKYNLTNLKRFEELSRGQQGELSRSHSESNFLPGQKRENSDKHFQSIV